MSLSRKRRLTLEMVRKLDRQFDLQKIGRINRDARSRTMQQASSFKKKMFV
ncbi:hypothetical protein [Microcoleus sp. D3_18a_C4]|uniref:hypothetical protein n=1 Tax=unclassified Microcoleus TaxID=2642155 RepID=UPI002FD79E93